MRPAISAICPAWQAAATLAETLASIRAQILAPTEIIVVDDGSSDETRSIGLAAGARVISKSHGGTAAALNAGIATSRGELLAFIDADDLWPANKLSAQTRLLASNPMLAGVLGLVQCFLSPELESDAATRYRLPEDPQHAWLTGALLMHRRVFDTVGPFDEGMHAGFHIDWFDRARRLGHQFAMPPRVVLLRRLRPGSLSHRSPSSDAGYALMARRAIQRRRAAGDSE